jgi:molybdate transport system substrate-binding protein
MISTAVSAAEINFVSSTAMREPLEELIPAFEKASGHKVAVAFYPAATLVIKVKEGVPADLVMTTPDNIETLTKDGKLVAGSRVDFAHSSVGVAVRAGAPKPDISTPDGLTRCSQPNRSVSAKGPAASI